MVDGKYLMNFLIFEDEIYDLWYNIFNNTYSDDIIIHYWCLQIL